MDPQTVPVADLEVTALAEDGLVLLRIVPVEADVVGGPRVYAFGAHQATKLRALAAMTLEAEREG
jgi:hypothetical protein